MDHIDCAGLEKGKDKKFVDFYQAAIGQSERIYESLMGSAKALYDVDALVYDTNKDRIQALILTFLTQVGIENWLSEKSEYEGAKTGEELNYLIAHDAVTLEVVLRAAHKLFAKGPTFKKVGPLWQQEFLLRDSEILHGARMIALVSKHLSKNT